MIPFSTVLKYYSFVVSILTLLTVVVFLLFVPQFFSIPICFIPLFFAVCGLMSVYFVHDKKGLRFSSLFMLVNMIKLITYLVFFVVIYLNLDQIKRLPFALTVMVDFVVFSVFDSIMLLRSLKSDNNSL